MEAAGRAGAVLRAMDGGVDAVLAGVAAGLEHLNRRGIYWVDFKPDNILVPDCDNRHRVLRNVQGVRRRFQC